jgi:Cu2+-exporting ATPase
METITGFRERHAGLDGSDVGTHHVSDCESAYPEMRSVMGASRALEKLVRLLPDTAAKLDQAGKVTEVPIAELVAGDRVLIRPGASAIGGAINGASAAAIEVTATGSNTYLAKVISLVEEPQATRSRTQEIANCAVG